MRSHLTRYVFRQLLASQPVLHRGCLRRRAYGTAVQTTRGWRPGHNALLQAPQRRGFFDMGIFRKPKRQQKEADMLPGMADLMMLEKLRRVRARLPTPDNVANSCRQFVAAKRDSGRPLEDREAALLLRALKFCRDAAASPGHAEEGFASWAKTEQPTLHAIMHWLFKKPGKGYSEAHVELASFVWRYLEQDHLRRKDLRRLRNYCIILCRAGRPQDAQGLLIEYERSNASLLASKSASGDLEASADDGDNEPAESTPKSMVIMYAGIWATLLETYIAQAKAQEKSEVIQRTVQQLAERGLLGHPRVAYLMMRLAMDEGHVTQVHRWWTELQTTFERVDPAYHHATNRASGQHKDALHASRTHSLLQWCASTGNFNLGQQVVRDIMKSNPPKPLWDAIFVWAAATGKSVDEVGRMIGIMETSNKAIPDQSAWRLPDVNTINGLVEFAMSKKDPYMAERFIALGRERGIVPDARTCVLQMEYRLSIGDVDGALTAYMNLQATDLSSDEDVPTVNKLLVALCKSKRHDFDTIMNVAGDLADRRARFAPETVATLALLHLNRDETHDVTDLLNTHAYHFSSAERTSIRDAIVEHCLDPATATPRAWDAYAIIREVFDELPRGPRTELMTSFFKRDRPDMAVHVFNHMRAHSREDTIPTVDTYVAAFLGSARQQDLESLEVIHNQLKLDYNIDVTTRLRNALMIAYTACSQPRRALTFWDEIVASREGPTYNSLHIALRACEHAPFGDTKAQEIWTRLRKMNIDLDRDLWASYLGALVGQSDLRQAVSTLEKAVSQKELDVDEFVLGSLFIACPGPVKQGDLEMWARQRYPEVWHGVVSKGVVEEEDGTRRLVGVDRSVMP
jgi:hypothetical protein